MMLNNFTKKPTVKDLPKSVVKDMSEDMKQMVDDASSMLFAFQCDFYRDAYYFIVKVLIAVLIALIFSIVVNVGFIIKEDPEPNYFWTNAKGQVGKIEPINKKIFSDDQVRSFLVEAIPEILSFNYDNFARATQKSAVWFTDEGFNAHLASVESQGLKEQIESRRLLFKSAAQSVPVVDPKETGVFAGVYVWTFTVDVVSTMSDRVKSKSVVTTYKFYVTRVPGAYRERQMAIYNYTPVGSKLN